MSTGGSAGMGTFNDVDKKVDHRYINFVGATVPVAATAVTVNPSDEQTSFTGFNFSEKFMLFVVKGKDATGSAITLGSFLIPPNNSTGSIDFNSYKRSGGDLSQIIDAVDVVPVDVPTAAGATTVTVAAATILPTGVVASALVNFGNS